MKLTAQQALGMAWAINEYGQDVMIQQQGHWLTLDFFTTGVVVCVWDTTGSVYPTESLGGGTNNAVADDPIFTPGDYVTTQLPKLRLLHLLHSITDERDSLQRQLRAVSDAQEESARQRREWSKR